MASLLAAAPHNSAAGGGPLAKVDEALNRWKTLDDRYTIITTDSDGDKTKIKLRMRMKAARSGNKQLTEISAPADMKGTKVLIKSPTEMYIYLPAFKKVRRIASHVTEQGFLGTALSQRDMAITRYGEYYTATIGKRAGGKTTLKLTAKAGSHAPYSKIEMVVQDKRSVPVELRYFNEDGKHIKTETRSKYKCKKNICAPGRMKMVDHTRGVTSVLKLRKHKVNPKLSKSLFSKRQLLP